MPNRESPTVSAFVGLEGFTRPADVDQGVVPGGYLDTILAGVSYWENRSPGFAREFRETTEAIADERVVALRRVDG